MKKVIQQEVELCDVPGCEHHASCKCLRCGRDFCYEHSKTEAVEYAHSLHFRGSYDGDYCKECDALLSHSELDPLHNAYRRMEALRAESEVFYKGLNAKTKAAEEEIQRIRKGRPSCA